MQTTLLKIAAIMALLVSLQLVSPVFADDKAAEEEDAGVQYRLVGPASGGRATRVVGIPGDPLTYYLSTAAGGVWKSSNGGGNWESIFDDQPISSIGSVAIASGNS
ncbi:MAG: hypothetical protein WBM76_02105, partial [Woeseiaceae bacterium]